LDDVRAGAIAIEEAIERLRRLPYEDLGFAKVDHHRALRKGFPEVVLGQGKTVEQLVAIATRLLEQSNRLLITRVDERCYETLKASVADAMYHPLARAITIDRDSRGLKSGIAVVCAGTADVPIAEEAAVTAELMGSHTERLYDVGVAGLHRLLDGLDALNSANAIVVVAGMDGALPSVVGGLVSAPVIAVPTSVGYGTSFQGLAPLLTMLNTCAAGVAVVNIDNGFGAGYMAAVINAMAAKEL
jgi:NCAIR mutase (PurE)-related protein